MVSAINTQALNRLLRGSNVEGLTCKLGFWSALTIAVLVVCIDMGMILSTLLYPLAAITTIEAYAASFTVWQMLPFVPSLILALLFPALMLCIHNNTADEKRVLTQLSLAFAVTCSAILSIHYYLQLSIVQQGLLANQTDGLWLLSAPNPHSLFWTLAALGYGFMGMALLAAFPAFDGKTERNIKLLLAANGAVGIAMLIGNALGVFAANIFASFIWGILFPIAAILLAKSFKKS